jgi:hypothetical protein
LFVVINKLNSQLDNSSNDENIKIKINSIQKIKDLVDTKLLEL